MKRASTLAGATLAALWCASSPGPAHGGKSLVDPLVLEQAVVADPEGVTGEGEATAALETRRPALVACHDAHKTPPVGTVVVLVVFDKTGKASVVRAGGSGHAKLDACVVKAVGGARLVRVAGAKSSVWVSASFVFDLPAAMLREAEALRGGPDAGILSGSRHGEIGALDKRAPGGPGGPVTKPDGPASVVTYGRISASEGLDDAVVHKALASTQLGRMRACHQRALRVDPTVAGELELRLVVNDAGKVHRVTVERSAVPGDLRDCAVDGAQRARLPPPQVEPGEVIEVRWVIRFGVKPAE